MTTLADLVGREIAGIVDLAGGALAIRLRGERALYLTVLLLPRDARWALFDRLPAAADPRGSRYAALESAVGRRRAVVAAERDDDGAGFTLRLEPEGRLSLRSREGRADLCLLRSGDDTLIASARGRSGGPGPAGSDAAGAARKPASVHEARTDEEREALRARVRAAARDELDRAIARAIATAERALTRRLEALDGDLARANDHLLDRRRGEILLAGYREIPKGASLIELSDPFADSPEARVTIALDPALSVQENVARLFRRAKKGERGRATITKRIDRTRASVLAVTELREALRDAAPREAFQRLAATFVEEDLEHLARGEGRMIRPGGRATDSPRAPRPGRRPKGARHPIRPRTFYTSDGWEVWVGRSNADNDRITHHLSNPHDFWLHVVGVPGSHVILRRPTRTAVPKPRTLEEAAGYAAWFSKARKLSRATVLYTERKFVSKPRRAKPGQALCTRERELVVRPLRPSTISGSDDG